MERGTKIEKVKNSSQI